MAAQFVLALALAALIGLSLGLLGSGGSIVTLPVLVYVAKVPPETAVAMSLAIVGATSLVGGGIAWRRGFVQVRETLLFAAVGMLGAALGAQVTHFVSPALLMLLFAGLMLVVGLRMLLVRGAKFGSAQEFRPVRFALVGLAVGVLTGFLGVGGGFMIVPALAFFGGFELRRAIGSSLVIIALNSASGLVGQLLFVAIDWTLTLAFLAASLVGIFLGSTVAGRCSEANLRKTFAWSVIAVGCALAAVNLRSLVHLS